MKLLDWMHRKLRQKSAEPFKEFTTGNSYGCLSMQPSFYEHLLYQKPTFSSGNSRQLQGGRQNSPSELITKGVEEVSEEEPSIMIAAPFDGFLMIGTLGLEPVIAEPSTPKFPIPFAEITEKETEVTENDLKFINDELEKFLEAEAKELGDELSERGSHVSIITIGGRPIEGVDTEEYGDIGVCPLQGYLFGSPFELPESAQVGKERTSLGHLFKMNDIAYDHSKNKCEKLKSHAKGTYAMRFIKKMIAKLHSHPTPRSSAGSAGGGATADSASTKRKLPKVLRILQRKIHPQRSTAEIKKSSIDSGYNKGALAFQDKYGIRSPLGAMLQKEINNSNVTHEMLNNSGFNLKKEHWIKTDADYLVLEL